MKKSNPCRLVRAILLSVALAYAPAARADLVTMKDGRQYSGLIAGQVDEAVLLETQPEPTLPAVLQRLPLSQVAALRFAPNSALEQWLWNPSAPNQEAVAALWDRFEPLLKNEGSPASKIGLRLGLSLLNTKVPASHDAALALFTRITSDSPNPSDRAAAFQGKLRALLSLGKKQEALAEANAALQNNPSPALKAEAQLTLASLAEAQFREFLEENPRWKEDPRVRPEHDALYHKLLDFYLPPSLNAEVPAELAQRALWGAFNIYRLCDELPKAVEIARDILVFFPNGYVAQSASTFLESLPPAALEIPPAANTHPSSNAQKPTVSANEDYANSKKTTDAAPAATPAPRARKRSRAGTQQNASGPLP